MSIISFDFESAAPLIRQKPTSCFTLSGKSTDDILRQFKVDRNCDLLILMQGPITAEQASEIGWKISEKMSKDSLVVWAAEESPVFAFDFYVYEHVEKNRAFQQKNIMDYYRLTSKILKSGILSERDSAHLAVMFSDAACQCDPENGEIDLLFDRLLSYNIKKSKMKKYLKKTKSKSDVKKMQKRGKA